MKMKLLMTGVAVVAAASGAYAVNQITRSVTAAGGMGSAGATHAIRSTLGQAVAGRVAAPIHSLGSGFWTPGFATSDLADETAVLPSSFELYPNQPNPFEGTTSLRYDVPRSAGRVSLRIYDVNGRLVRTLVHKEETPGAKIATWDGRDNQGERVSLGVYVCTFEAPGFNRTRKLVVMR